jgi:hypothetical protein
MQAASNSNFMGTQDFSSSSPGSKANSDQVTNQILALLSGMTTTSSQQNAVVPTTPAISNGNNLSPNPFLAALTSIQRPQQLNIAQQQVPTTNINAEFPNTAERPLTGFERLDLLKSNGNGVDNVVKQLLAQQLQASEQVQDSKNNSDDDNESQGSKQDKHPHHHHKSHRHHHSNGEAKVEVEYT